MRQNEASRACVWKAEGEPGRTCIHRCGALGAGRSSGIFLGRASERMGALLEQWAVYKERVGAPDPAAAAATAAALAGAGFTTVASPALRPAQRAALVRPSGTQQGCRVAVCRACGRLPPRHRVARGTPCTVIYGSRP